MDGFGKDLAMAVVVASKGGVTGRRHAWPGGEVGSRLFVVRAAGAVPDAAYLLAGGVTMDGFGKDLAMAVRGLRRRPGFAVVAVLTLALGIGANTALFSIVQGVLLRPLVLGDPAALVGLRGINEASPEHGNVSYPNLRDVSLQSTTLESVAGASSWRPAFTEADNAAVVRGLTVSWNYFGVLGVEPVLGRFFDQEEEGEGRRPVVVLDFGLWQTRFGGDLSVVGQTVQLDNQAYEVVGVTPRMFEDPVSGMDNSSIEVWRTPWFEAPDWFRSGRSWKGVARLSAGATVEMAGEELATIMTRLAEAYPEENAKQSMVAVPLRELIVGDVRRGIMVLFGAVGFLLLISCANVANLLLGRAAERQHDVAVRRALGASRGRLAAQVMSESLVLAVLGGVVGVALAYLGLDVVVGLAAGAMPRLEGIGIDSAVLVFTAAVSVFTGLLFGIIPAVHGTRGTGSFAIGASERQGTGGRARGRLRRALVVAELSLTVVLLVGAGLFVRSLWLLGAVDVGVSTETLVTMDLHGSAWWDLDEDEAEALYDGVFGAVGAVPGVQAVGAIDILPLSDNHSCDGTRREDLPPPAPGEGECAEVRSVTPGAFSALGVRLLQGRMLGRADGKDDVRVAVVSKSTAEMFWAPDERVVGTPIRIHSETWEVVGIVSDVRHYGPGEPPRAHVYLPAVQEPWNGISRGMTLAVRADMDPASLAPQIRSAIQSVNSTIPVDNVQTGQQLLRGSVAGPRFRSAVLLSFGVVGLLLSMIGVVGVMAFSVSQRRREIGVRMALGAARSTVRSMVLREGLTLILAGIAIGVPTAVAVGRLVSGLLFGVSATDLWILVPVPLVLASVAYVACYFPATRAARVDPMESLRSE